MTPRYITAVAPLQSGSIRRRVSVPVLPRTIEDQWMIQFGVHYSHEQEAQDLCRRLEDAARNSGQSEQRNLLSELHSLYLPEIQACRGVNFWNQNATTALRPESSDMQKLKDFISSRIRGRALEAMCGLDTYILPSASREVVAVDYAEEALLRYPYPEQRERILFDIEQWPLSFFPPESFDAVVVTEGFRFLNEPRLVYSEFRRILKPGGKLYIIEHSLGNYILISRKKYFSVDECFAALKTSGLKDQDYTRHEIDDYSTVIVTSSKR